MAIWLLVGLIWIWPVFGINCEHVEDDPKAAAIGDERSPAYYRRNARPVPVIVLGEPLRVRGTKESAQVPGFVFRDGIREGDDDQEDWKEDEQGDGEGDEHGDGEGDEHGDDWKKQPSLPMPPTNINMQQVCPNYLHLCFNCRGNFLGASSVFKRRISEDAKYLGG